MLWLIELPKRLRLGWHEWWMDTHMQCADEVSEDMWKFMELENYSETKRLGEIAREERERAAYHSFHALDILSDLS